MLQDLIKYGGRSEVDKVTIERKARIPRHPVYIAVFCVWHYKIFCVNGNTGFRNESRIFYFIHLQNEEAYERKESSSA